MKPSPTDGDDIRILEAYCGWLAIPRGYAGQNLRIALRLMFKTNVAIRDEHSDALRRIFDEWPTFLSRTGWQPNIYTSSDGKSVQTTAMPESLGETFSKSLSFVAHARTGLHQVNTVWRAAFPDAGVREPYVVPNRPSAWDTQPHAQAAIAINHSLGGLNAMALAAGSDNRDELLTHAGSRAFNFSSKKSKSAIAPAADKLQELLDEFSGKLLGPAARGRKPDALERAAASQNIFQEWQARVRDEDSSIEAANLARTDSGKSALMGQSTLEAPSVDKIWKLMAYTMSDTNDTYKALQESIAKNVPKAGTTPKSYSLRIAKQSREIAHHGWLLRYLGLVVDIMIPRAAWMAVGSAIDHFVPGAVVIDSKNGYPLAGDVKTSPGFPQKHGVVTLYGTAPESQHRFELMQLDVQSAARKLVQAAMTHNALRDSAAAPADKSYETSALRSNGLTLVDRDTDRRSKRQDQKSLWNLPIMHAEDITLGIRPDVQTLQLREGNTPVQGPWRSLTGWKIRSAYVLVGPLPDPLTSRVDVSDHFKGLQAGEALLGASHRLISIPEKPDIGAIVSEEVFTWDGWSLAVGHPDPGATNKRPAFSKLQVGRLVVTMEAAGDMPTLRVGRGYMVGVRAVYVDGDGTSLDDAIANAYRCEEVRPIIGLPGVPGGRAFFPYMRYEPIAPPDIHLGAIVDYAQFPQVSSRKAVVASSANAQNQRTREVRYLVPPAVSLEQAINLGMYDSNERRSQPPQSAFKGVCLTPGGRFPNVSNGVVPKEAVAPRGSNAGDATDTLFHPSGVASSPIIPYLPDPWARRMVIGAFRTSDGELLAWESHDYYDAAGLSNWPHCKPLRLEIHRAHDHHVSLPQTYGSVGGRVDFRKQGSTLHLYLPAGEDLKIHVWHEIDERVLTQSAIVDQMADYLLNPDAQACCRVLGLSIQCVNDKQRAREELIHCLSAWQELRHNLIRSEISRALAERLTNITSFAMINPSNILHVVHAVDQPPTPRFLWSGLAQAQGDTEPELRRIIGMPASRLRRLKQSIRIEREIGRTDAVLAGDLEIDRPTTTKVDFTFTWSDQVDDLADAGPQVYSRKASARVEQIPAVLTRLIDPMLQGANTRTTPDQAPDNSLMLLAGMREGRATNEDLRNKQLTIAFGDTRARIVDVTAVAYSRFADEFKPEATRFDSAPAHARQLVCPSSASPSVPSIDYVMPQYHWLDNNDAHRSHERVGGCFRVWLNRPWFSSGVDERLAVVCWPESTFDKTFSKQGLYNAWADICGINKDPPAFLEAFVTRWGLDPIWQMQGNACVGSVPAEAFRRHICDSTDLVRQSKAENCFPVLDLRKCQAVQQSLAVADPGNAKVVLVQYEPVYDKGSRRHYVDIQVDEKYAYYPFLRLALARYQPYSLPGFELSEITAYEFVQLPPSRRTQVDVFDKDERSHTVKLGIALRGAIPAVQAKKGAWSTHVTARLDYLPSESWEAIKASVPGSLGKYGVAWVPEYETTVPLQRSNAGQWEVPKAHSQFTLQRKRIYSVVIEEFEVGFQDDLAADPRCIDGEATILFGTPVKRLSRRIFADRLLLPELW